MGAKHQLPLRCPDDVKVWLQQQAEINGSSQNSEAIRAIRERMERTAPREGQTHE